MILNYCRNYHRVRGIWGLVCGGLVFMILFVLSHQAWATSQWARKYDMGCTSCHTAFPRLTYFGEKFMKNGYQMPGTEDGDDNKERIGSSLVLDELQNLFGIRLSLTPLKIKNDEGGKKSDINIGNADWLQLFTAGSIFKNTSIFIETELQDEKTIHHNWFHLGFHNLFGQSLANIRVGKLSPMDWHSMSGRLRMIPNVNVQAISYIESSKGNGADSVPLGSGVPAIEVYGYKGPAIYSLGISNGNGKSATDPNEYKNVFGTIKLEMPSGLLEGSSISCWGMNGVDTTDSSKTFYKNDFWRSSIAGNLRWTDLDLIIAGFYGEDDNWNLDSNNNKNIFKAGALQLGYNFIPSLYGVLQYDIVGSEDDKTIEFNKITPSIWYFPRENMRFGLTGRLDIQPTSDVHLKRQDEFTATFRMML